MAEFTTITTEISEGLLTLTINRPDRMNAFNGEMMKDMIAAFDMADADDSVRAVIVTGAGDRAFARARIWALARTRLITPNALNV